MKERALPLDHVVARAILDSRATRVCLPLKRQPLDVLPMRGDMAGRGWVCLLGREPSHGMAFRCGWGEAGDRLWVKEPFDHIWRNAEEGWRVWYKADDAWWQEYPPLTYDWRPCPRWASRLLLEIVAVQVVRLHDTTEEDAEAAGFRPYDTYCTMPGESHLMMPDRTVTALEQFEKHWRGARRKAVWHTNPWIWRIDIKRQVAP